MPGRVERLQNRPVPRCPMGSRDVGRARNRLGLLGGEDVLREPLLHPRQLELGGRVVEEMVLAREPLEERPHGHRGAACWLRKRQRLAVLLCGSGRGGAGSARGSACVTSAGRVIPRSSHQTMKKPRWTSRSRPCLGVVLRPQPLAGSSRQGTAIALRVGRIADRALRPAGASRAASLPLRQRLQERKTRIGQVRTTRPRCAPRTCVSRRLRAASRSPARRMELSAISTAPATPRLRPDWPRPGADSLGSPRPRPVRVVPLARRGSRRR